MPSFNEIFDEPLDCYFALFQDAVFEHSHYDELDYVFEANHFKLRNRIEVINKIKAMAEALYNNFVNNDSSFAHCQPLINYPTLLSVLTRYSRDIYGFRRISAKIRKIGASISKAEREQLEQIILDGADFGFKIPSSNPYIERQAAVLLYWFSVLKPFHLSFNEGGKKPPEQYIQAYFNEYFSYFLICMALHTQSVNLIIHEDEEIFKEFLNQLHFRNLSRSSLEFFLPSKRVIF